MTSKHPHGAPMDLANMRRQGVRTLNAVCLDPACRHELVFGVDDYDGDLKLSWFPPRMICAKCDGPVDVRPNWNEADPEIDWRGTEAMPGGE